MLRGRKENNDKSSTRQHKELVQLNKANGNLLQRLLGKAEVPLDQLCKAICALWMQCADHGIKLSLDISLRFSCTASQRDKHVQLKKQET